MQGGPRKHKPSDFCSRMDPYWPGTGSFGRRSLEHCALSLLGGPPCRTGLIPFSFGSRDLFAIFSHFLAIHFSNQCFCSRCRMNFFLFGLSLIHPIRARLVDREERNAGWWHQLGSMFSVVSREPVSRQGRSSIFCDGLHLAEWTEVCSWVFFNIGDTNILERR